MSQMFWVKDLIKTFQSANPGTFVWTNPDGSINVATPTSKTARTIPVHPFKDKQDCVNYLNAQLYKCLSNRDEG